MTMKTVSLVWAGTVEKSELSDVVVGRNRAEGKNVAAAAIVQSILAGLADRCKNHCVCLKLTLCLFMPIISSRPKFQSGWS